MEIATGTNVGWFEVDGTCRGSGGSNEFIINNPPITLAGGYFIFDPFDY